MLKILIIILCENLKDKVCKNLKKMNLIKEDLFKFRLNRCIIFKKNLDHKNNNLKIIIMMEI